jgi:hypothetical protein
MIPFTRHALWRTVEKCRLFDSSFSLSASPGSLPPSQPSSHQDPSSSVDNQQATQPLAPSAPPPLFPPPPPPLQIPPFPVVVFEALDNMQLIDPVGSGILVVQAVMMQHA